MADEHQWQPYDSALKSLIDDHAAEMLPEILPESKFLSEKNSEIARTNLRPDLVYLIEYRDKPHILNLELQAYEDSDMPYRMLLYHVELYGKYRLPIISMVMYPFETSILETVFQEENGAEDLLIFHYRALRLWRMDARIYISKRVVSMYTLLPAMKNATASLLIQAIYEMEQQYVGVHLTRHLVRFRTILRRSTTLSLQDKQKVEERLHMYDSLLDLDPELQERMAQAEIRGQQKTVIEVIQARFPKLVETAKNQVMHFDDPEKLSLLVKQIATAPNEPAARWILDNYAA